VDSRCDFHRLLVPALRRVDGVRVTMGSSGPRAEVYGIGHRHEVAVAVSMPVADQLIAAGAPLTFRDERAAMAGERRSA
jgi:hypothetical protein